MVDDKMVDEMVVEDKMVDENKISSLFNISFNPTNK